MEIVAIGTACTSHTRVLPHTVTILRIRAAKLLLSATPQENKKEDKPLYAFSSSGFGLGVAHLSDRGERTPVIAVAIYLCGVSAARLFRTSFYFL